MCSTQYFRYACWLWKHVSIQQKSPIIICIISSWWLNQPIWKICSSNWSEFPQNSRNENKQIFDLPPPSIINVLFPSKKCQDGIQSHAWLHFFGQVHIVHISPRRQRTIDLAEALVAAGWPCKNNRQGRLWCHENHGSVVEKYMVACRPYILGLWWAGY